MYNCPAPQSRKLLLGDANAILRVWTFLDAWGLINHEAPAGPAAPAQPPFDIATAGARAVSALGSCVVHRALLSHIGVTWHASTERTALAVVWAY